MSLNKSLFALFVCVLLIATVPIPSAHGAVINDLAGPSDYGAMIQPVRYDLGGFNIGDERQNQVADCYERAVVDSILIQYGPSALARNYQVLTDGTIDVRLYKGSVPFDYIESPGINPWYGDPNTGNDGANGDAAGDIIAKAWARQRTAAGTIMGTAYGTPGEFMLALGWSQKIIPTTIPDVIQAFQSGAIVDMDTWFSPPAGIPADHSLAVESVDPVAGTITVYNPWGSGYPDYPAHVTLSSLDGFTGVWAGLPGGAVAPAPEPASLAMLGMGAWLLLRRKSLST